jgi:hypothetical protein
VNEERNVRDVSKRKNLLDVYRKRNIWRDKICKAAVVSHNRVREKETERESWTVGWWKNNARSCMWTDGMNTIRGYSIDSFEYRTSLL